MRTIKCLALALSALVLITSCGNNPENMGNSTPIDSTNVSGAAPATYGGDNPAIDPDSNRTNVGDTGTKANNVHNTPDDNRR